MTTMVRYWFKPKRYGYGAIPTTWEGWLTIVSAIAVTAALLAAEVVLARRFGTVSQMLWAAVALVVAFYLCRFIQQHTDCDWRWRWGNRLDRN
jgi:hypothetical protein